MSLFVFYIFTDFPGKIIMFLDEKKMSVRFGADLNQNLDVAVVNVVS